MPNYIRVGLFALSILWSSDAFAQAGYLTNGGPGIGVSVFTQQHGYDGERGSEWVRVRGAEFLALPSSHFSLGIGFGATSYSEEQFENGHALALGFQYYNSRQGLDAPLTMGVGATVGRVSISGVSGTTLTLDTEASRVVGVGNSPVSFVPALGAGVGFLFIGGSRTSSTTFSLALGLRGRMLDQAALYVEPTYSVVLEGSERVGFVGVTIGTVAAL